MLLPGPQKMRCKQVQLSKALEGAGGEEKQAGIGQGHKPIHTSNEPQTDSSKVLEQGEVTGKGMHCYDSVADLKIKKGGANIWHAMRQKVV